MKKAIIEGLKNVGSVIFNLFLFVLAIIIFVFLLLPAFFWKVYVSITKEERKAREILSGTAQFFKAMAISVDLFGNVAYSGLFNRYLLIDGKYLFGSPYETISEVLGWAQHYNDLTKGGKILVSILDFLDKNHCEKTRLWGIQEAEEKFNRSLNE